MTELMNEMNQQMMSIKPSVQIWMNWMMICFALSLVFVFTYKTARWALAAFFAVIPLGLVVFKITGTVHLLGIAHWLVWFPMAIYIYKHELTTPQNHKGPLFKIWVRLLFATIAICLAFDVWDFSQVALGRK